MNKDELGTRMKEFYEQVPKTRLMKRCPVILRIDGRAFHTFTKSFQRPFDNVLIQTMQDTMLYLCENIQGCVFGYTQSDEINLVLVDYKKLNSSAWFDYEVQKMCSIAASMATVAFNKYFRENVEDFTQNCAIEYETHGLCGEGTTEFKLCKAYEKKVEKGAMFDARCFNLPKEEVANYIYWRQLDASRNSIQMVGQANFSHKELQNKSCDDIKDMLMNQKSINWNDLETHKKRGSCCIKKGVDSGRSQWIIDYTIPIFKGENREYIERFVYLNE